MDFSIGSTFGVVSVVVNVLLVLSVFSYFYDRKIASLGARGEGWAWLQVVGGVFVTLIGIGLLDLVLDWNAFFTSLLAFAASGWPMMRGAYLRYREAMERAEKAAKE